MANVVSENGEPKSAISYKHPDFFAKVNEQVLMPGTTEEMLDCLSRLKVCNDDVIITSWPKSGTTWTMEIVWQLYNDGKIDETQIDKKVKFLDTMFIPADPANPQTPNDVIKTFQGLPRPRLLKTHLNYQYVPMGEDRGSAPKTIVVMRNPKDAFVSYFNHYTGLAILQCDTDWEEFFELALSGDVFGSWFDFVRSWWPHRHDPNVMFLRYKDLKQDLPAMIQRIASFLELRPNADLMAQVAQQTTFSAMRDRPSFDHSWFGQKPGRKFEFLWKGKVGSWKDFFTEEQNRRFDRKFKQEMAGTGFDLSYFD
ncbi:sulfotransferase 1B1 isoform X2 [Nematostella vectensis]|uniref:sulfotransferase 1B1 isoform X2 n=1 Tax=Nematostella vectensis TaxID=45351 RepID=UPI0013900671|nr:sulfotransferase 1B1 isoform X2 [Nematostella vectensis]